MDDKTKIIEKCFKNILGPEATIKTTVVDEGVRVDIAKRGLTTGLLIGNQINITFQNSQEPSQDLINIIRITNQQFDIAIINKRNQGGKD